MPLEDNDIPVRQRSAIRSSEAGGWQVRKLHGFLVVDEPTFETPVFVLQLFGNGEDFSARENGNAFKAAIARRL